MSKEIFNASCYGDRYFVNWIEVGKSEYNKAKEYLEKKKEERNKGEIKMEFLIKTPNGYVVEYTKDKKIRYTQFRDDAKKYSVIEASEILVEIRKEIPAARKVVA